MGIPRDHSEMKGANAGRHGHKDERNNGPGSADENRTSVARDTIPDITFVKMWRTARKGATWRNTGHDMGSDHDIMEMVFPLDGQATSGNKKHRITNWDAYRRLLPTNSRDIEDIDQWTSNIIDTTERATKELPTEERTTNIDSRCAHLLEAKHSIKQGGKGRGLTDDSGRK